MHIDINCDTGEGIGNDESLMSFITSANIACGYHAGNEETMRTTVMLAKKHGVHAGAHPSFPDKENFGRTEMPCTPQELYHFVSKQLHHFDKIAAECGVPFHHVKPHGALYNMAARDAQLAQAFALAVKDFKSELIVYGLSNSHLVAEAKKLGLPAMHDVFADRAYQEDGSLTPRSQANALIEDEDKAIQQVLQMVEKKTVVATSGKEIAIHADTVCIHGDGKHAVSFAKKFFTLYNNAVLSTKPSKFRFFSGASLGAAFLMANSSIGPGFLTQTTVFTQQLLTSFGFVILVSVLLDIGAQLNTWRVLTISERRVQDLANDLLPGLGYFLSALVIMGGFAFNIGNIAGCGLGVNVLTGLSFEQGAIISCVVALVLFWIKEVGKMLDSFTKVLGTLKILLTLIIAFAAHPPLAQAVHHTFVPEHINTTAIVTIVGGTVGGYITFSGAHRLLDAGIKGKENLHTIDRSAISGVVISTVMRFILFLAIVGVVQKGIVLDKDNPAATVFASAAGQLGLKIFGVVLWSAAISSVVGAAYTSVSFFKTFHPFFQKHERWCISVFIVLTTIVFVAVGKPKQLLILAGAVNGLILPVALAIVLVAAAQKRLMKGYKHPLWMQAAGWIVVAAMGYMGWLSLLKLWSA